MTLVADMTPQRRGRERSEAEVVVGDDWVAPRPRDAAVAPGRRRRGRGLWTLRGSPLARKIILFNLVALMVLVSGVLFLNPFRDSLVQQRAEALVVQAEMAAAALSARLDTGAVDHAALLERLPLRGAVEVHLLAPDGALLGHRRAPPGTALPGADDPGDTVLTDALNRLWDGVASVLVREDPAASLGPADLVSRMVPTAAQGETRVQTARDTTGATVFAVVTPVRSGGEVRAVLALTSAEGELDRLLRREREQVLQVFVLAILVSIGLSLVLASTIANPIADLAAAAEVGRDRSARKMAPERVRIPDLAARPDEIGQLSVAMRGMVAALYDRIETNEQFAADVAHEIKNPLASLRSAVGTLRVARRDDQREKLLAVIEHDVRRLDRLVSDISNASRLDAELVKEAEEAFDLVQMLRNLGQYLGQEAETKGIEFIELLPDRPIHITGLEARLAQVFVNLITNAISFCNAGDAVRVWARQTDNRVIVVVEDTGPGIPDGAEDKIFKRFYSERPVKQFGNHSGLGLAISKQIVEAHGGVIWAENIRPGADDPVSAPLGARFVVGLPV